MEQESPEKQIQKLEKIQLGQEFLLFDPLRIERLGRPGPIDREFVLMLGLSNPSKLYFRSNIGCSNTVTGTVRDSFLPFGQVQGYVVTREDYNSETRKAKLANVLRDESLYSKYYKPLSINYGLWLIAVMLPFGERISAEAVETLNKLRLRLSIGNMLLETRSLPLEYSKDKKEHGTYFDRFYPADAGALAPDIDGERGQRVWVPDSIDKLSQIRARFVLADQEPVEKEG